MKYRELLLLLAGMFFYANTLYGNVSTEERTTVTTIDGDRVTIEALADGLRFKGYEDKIVLLEFFGHSCPPCRASIPGYNRLQKKYADDVVVIAIESWALDKEKLKRYVKEHKIDYKVVARSDAGKVFSFVQRMTGWNPNYGVPFLMLFSPGGKLAKSLPPGGLNEVYVESLIEEIRKK